MEQNGHGPRAGNQHHPLVSRRVLYSPQHEPALLASMPESMGMFPGPWPGSSSRQTKRELLAALLRENFPWGKTRNFSLVPSHWGKPHLFLDGEPGPGVSFSWSAGAWWAALGTINSLIGLDAASPQEFTKTYPVNKVFRSAEWQAATSLTGGDREEAAALLWSAKEAVVKAWGCGYHCFGPRQVRIEFAELEEDGPRWRGRLEAPGPDHDLPGGPETLSVTSIRLNPVWLAVAWLPHTTSTSPAPGG